MGHDRLWPDVPYPELPAAATSAYRDLELTYFSVCQGMGDDAIRNRIALIRLPRGVYQSL